MATEGKLLINKQKQFLKNPKTQKYLKHVPKSPNYFYIKLLGDNNTICTYNQLQYSTDLKTWKTDNIIENVNKGTKIYFKVPSNRTRSYYYENGEPDLTHGVFFNSTYNVLNDYEIGGNIGSLYFTDFETRNYSKVKFDRECAYMFYKEKKLVSAKNLIIPFNNPDDEGLCEHMFHQCSSLAHIPKLPYTTKVGPSCYEGMFYLCGSIRQAPALPATTLADSCYKQMFSYSGVKYAPRVIPAKSIVSNACYEMFSNCLSLSNVPVFNNIQSTYNYACYNMFSNCTMLTDVANIFNNNNFSLMGLYTLSGMFQGCTSLITGPTNFIPGGTKFTYKGTLSRMFQGCTSLETTNIYMKYAANSQYAYMFSGCTSLKTVPTFYVSDYSENNCCQNMFSGCTSLTLVNDTRNITFSKTVGKSSCENMFSDCTKLVSTNKFIWSNIIFGGDNAFKCTFKNCKAMTQDINIVVDGVSGVSKSGFEATFFGCSGIKNVSLTIKNSPGERACYEMFCGCTSLINKSIVLSATSVSKSSYERMFYGCTSLTTAPELPATTLGIKCYSDMFAGCTSLTKAPTRLPAIKLADYCYQYMFANCFKLTESPYFVEYDDTNCRGNYSYMFQNCKSLNVIRVGFPYLNDLKTTDPDGVTIFSNWVKGVASVGTFYYYSNSTWLTITQDFKNESCIPSGWTVVKGN